MSSGDPLRLAAYPSRRFLPPDPGEPPLSLLGVPSERLAVAESPLAALELVLRTLLAPGDRVVIFEPCPPDHFRIPVACGARVVDAGRDASLRARQDGLLLATADGAVVVLVAEPGDPAPTEGDLAMITGALAADSGGPRAGDVWVIVDRRAGGLPDGGDCVQVLSTGGDDPIGLVVAPAGLAAALRRVRGPASPALVRRLGTATAIPTPSPPALALDPALGAQLVTGPAAHAFLRVPGVAAVDLAASLRERGIACESRASHSWRGGVRLALPADPVAMAAAVRAVSAAEEPPGAAG